MKSGLAALLLGPRWLIPAQWIQKKPKFRLRLSIKVYVNFPLIAFHVITDGAHRILFIETAADAGVTVFRDEQGDAVCIFFDAHLPEGDYGPFFEDRNEFLHAFDREWRNLFVFLIKALLLIHFFLQLDGDGFGEQLMELFQVAIVHFYEAIRQREVDVVVL